MNISKRAWIGTLAVVSGAGCLFLLRPLPAQQQTAPKFKFDPDWPKPLPNKWKMGGVTGLAVDKDDNVWVFDRPNDLTDIELEAELNPPLADCCVRPPSMIHIDKEGNVIGSFDAPQGHGMAVDSKGFVYIGHRTRSASTIPRPARWSAKFRALPRGRQDRRPRSAPPDFGARPRPWQRRSRRRVHSRRPAARARTQPADQAAREQPPRPSAPSIRRPRR